MTQRRGDAEEARTEVYRLSAIVSSQADALNHWRRLSDADAGEKLRLQLVIQEQGSVLRDCARMLDKHRGAKTEGAVLLDRKRGSAGGARRREAACMSASILLYTCTHCGRSFNAWSDDAYCYYCHSKGEPERGIKYMIFNLLAALIAVAVLAFIAKAVWAIWTALAVPAQ